MHKGKPLEAWFYGSNTTFFSKPTRDAAQEAINAVGTNAFPFLLSKLKEKRGNNWLYFKSYITFYGALPAWMEARLPYPLSGDDIKVAAFRHLVAIGQTLTADQIDAVADCVQRLCTPELKMRALIVATGPYQYQDARLLQRLLRKLLNDTDEGVRLQAALCLAEGPIPSGPLEPRLFSILLSGLESKTVRKRNLDDTPGITYQEVSGGLTFPVPTPVSLAFGGYPLYDSMLRLRVRTAFVRLEPHLTPEQKARLSQALSLLKRRQLSF